MTFFHEAIEDGTIDRRTKLTEEEIAAYIQSMVKDSNAWHQHIKRHKDAKIVGFSEDKVSDFDRRLGVKEEENPVIQYDKLTKHFMTGCQCGQKFEIDISDNTVKPADPNLRMKDADPYSKSKDGYGRGDGNDRIMVSYGNNPQQPNITYNSKEQNSGYKR